MNSAGNNPQLAALVNIYLSISSVNTQQISQASQSVFILIKSIFDEASYPREIKINFPYKDITDVVLYSNQLARSDSILNFRSSLENFIDRYLLTCWYWTDSEKKIVKSNFLFCHDKIVQHLLLAQTQREFIKSTINTVTLAANQAAQSAQTTASDAKNVADKAEATANKAEETYKSMFANYVAVLGIFTALVLAMFGGVNVINSISSNVSKMPTGSVIFLVTLALLCNITIMYFLAIMTVWMGGTRAVKLEKPFYFISGACILILIITAATII